MLPYGTPHRLGDPPLGHVLDVCAACLADDWGMNLVESWQATFAAPMACGLITYMCGRSADRF